MAEQPGKRRRPKGANGQGGANKRPNGSWSWRMTTADGRRHIAYGKTIGEAREKCEAKAGLAEKGIDVKTTKQRLGQYLDWWLTDIVEPKLAPKTVKIYRDTVRLHLKPDLGHIELSKLTAQAVTSLLRQKERDGLSPRSVAMIREVLRGALNTGVKMQMIERNVATLTPAPRQVKTERRMLSPEEAKRLLAAVDTDRLSALYRLALMRGLRQAEILGLRWEDVDLDAGTLRVRQTLQRVGKEIVIKEPKTARSRRTLALPSSLVTALKAHKDKQTFERSKAGANWQDTGLVFTTSVGTALEPRNLVRSFKRHLATAGLPKEWRFYDMRHSAASLLIADGMPITAVSAMLGHALTSTTLNVYAHVLPDADQRTADAMERLLG